MMTRPRSLRTQVAVACAVTLAVAAVVGTTSLLAVRSGARLAQALPMVQATSDLVGTLTAVDDALAKLSDVRISDAARRRALIDGARRDLAHLDEVSARLEGLEGSQDHAALWKEFKPLRDRWRENAAKLLELQRKKDEAATGKGDPVAQLLEDAQCMQIFVAMSDEYRAAQRILAQLVGADAAAAGKLGEVASATLTTGAWATLIACLVGVAGLVGVSLLIHRFIRRTADTLVAESDALRSAVDAGNLDRRAAPERVSGEFREVIAGMNRILDAVVAPLRVAAGQMDRIARGDIPPPIDEAWQGEFGALRDNMNQCSTTVSALLRDVRALTEAAVAGRLDERADHRRHPGDFGQVLREVNATLDALLAPAGEATQVLGRLAQRDLRARMEGSYQGDHDTMKQALNATAQALHDALAQVAGTVAKVSSAAEQIASSSQSVAADASQQASSLEETSSCLDSMTSMLKTSADSARQASALAGSARQTAADGADAMQQLSGAMRNIRAATESTSQIIKDINEIAFQTNLLALNAAVEAARAGEAGRGFAVVAEEVRSLALRSKEAATKTEVLIRESVKQTGEGEATARNVNAKLSEIAGSVAQVSDIVTEIAASAREQAAGIEQTNLAVGQMNQVTQQNATRSEESSSAAAELAGHSEQLDHLVKTFSFEGDEGDGRPVGGRPEPSAPSRTQLHGRGRPASCPW